MNEFEMYRGLRYRIDLAVRSLFRPRVWQRFPLPDALFPLYALLSPLDWCAFHLQRSKSRRRQDSNRKGQRPVTLATTARAQPSAFRNLLRRPLADLLLAAEAACLLSFFELLSISFRCSG